MKRMATVLLGAGITAAVGILHALGGPLGSGTAASLLIGGLGVAGLRGPGRPALGAVAGAAGGVLLALIGPRLGASIAGSGDWPAALAAAVTVLAAVVPLRLAGDRAGSERMRWELDLLDGHPGRRVGWWAGWRATRAWWVPTILWSLLAVGGAVGDRFEPGSLRVGPGLVPALAGALSCVLGRAVAAFGLGTQFLDGDRVRAAPPAARRPEFAGKLASLPPPTGPLVFESRPPEGPCTFGAAGE